MQVESFPIIDRRQSPVAVLDRGLKIKDLNPQFFSLFPVKKEDLIGKPVQEVLTQYSPKTDLNKLLKEILLSAKQFENHQPQVKPVITVSAQDGRSHYLELSPVNIVKTDGNKLHKLGFEVEIRDISERIKSQALNEAAKLINEGLEISNLIPKLERILHSVISYDRANIILKKDDKWVMLKKWVSPENGETSAIKEEVEVSLANRPYLNRMLENRSPKIVNDISADPEYFSKKKGAGSWLGAPIIINDEVVGFLNLDLDKTGVFNEEDARLLKSFADHFSVALKNSQEYSYLFQMAITDPLTRAYSRRFFDEAAKREISESFRTGNNLSFLYLDADHFKNINDTYGHGSGDSVLTALSRRGFSGIRSSDIWSRYGGEEFTCLLPDADIYQAFQTARKLKAVIEGQPIIDKNNNSINLTLSIGISDLESGKADSFPVKKDESEQIFSDKLNQADEASYAVKETGRNGIGVFLPKINDTDLDQIAVYRPIENGTDWQVQVLERKGFKNLRKIGDFKLIKRTDIGPTKNDSQRASFNLIMTLEGADIEIGSLLTGENAFLLSPNGPYENFSFKWLKPLFPSELGTKFLT